MSDAPSASSSPLRSLRQQLWWVRRDGIRKWAEEKELNLVTRTRSSLARSRWRAVHGVAQGEAVPVWLLGVQRSGTNLLVRSFKGSPEVAVYSENHRRAFHQYRLRDDAVVRALIRESDHRFVLFKPLCDLHRAEEFWGPDFGEVPSRIVWAYRSVDGRVRSAVARFGDSNLRLMRSVAAGEVRERWQTAGLGADQLDLIRSFDWGHESAESAAALFWYLRNGLLFRLGLHDVPRVTVVSYDSFVSAPATTLRRMERFLGLLEPLTCDVGQVRPSRPARLDLHPEIRRLCDDLERRLDGLLTRAEADPRGAVVGDRT